jgi:hypothetical protein
MRDPMMVGVALALAVGALAHGEPSVLIRGAAAQVAVVPGARKDIRVVVLSTNPRLPIRIRRMGSRLLIFGDVGRQIHNCGTTAAPGTLSVRGRGLIPIRALPRLVIFTPPEVRLQAGDAVFGVMGRSASVDFTNLGCGNWAIANTRGRLRVDQAGSGETRTGAAASGDLAVAGSGRIATHRLAHGLTAVSSESGDIDVAQVASGPVDARIAGTGSINVAAGRVGAMTASIAGSGNVKMGGLAQSLNAQVTGTGQVLVARVAGPVTRRTLGGGEVKVGP